MTTPKQVKSSFSSVSSWVKAEVSLAVEGPLSDEVYGLRIAECRACPQFTPFPEEGKVGWCKGCGCGTRVRAELSTKARMPAATCPLKKWPTTPSGG